MQQRNLGRHQIGAIGFGAMSLGGAFGETDLATSLRCLDAAFAAGITHIDTANIYGMGQSETAIGSWLKSRGFAPGQGPTIATKAAIDNGPPRRIRNDAAYLRQELEASLRRLGRDHVELFYIHRRDQALPLDELLETLDRLITEGKIGGYGLSEIAPHTLRQAHALLPCTAVQNEYSLWSRQPELGMIQACHALGVSFMAFSPLGRGMFTDRPLAAPTDAFRATNPRFTEPNFSANAARIDAFRLFAQSRGWTTTAAALAWVLQQGPQVIPIPGTRSAAHLQDWLAADQIRFTAADQAEITRLLPPGFAHGDRYGDHQLQAIERYC